MTEHKLSSNMTSSITTAPKLDQHPNDEVNSCSSKSRKFSGHMEGKMIDEILFLVYLYKSLKISLLLGA